ncbi:MAG: ATP-binding protein [Gemmatimonadetes bacterium]|nr:ATP-binding protein [Gemmatimonadota bacterium]
MNEFELKVPTGLETVGEMVEELAAKGGVDQWGGRKGFNFRLVVNEAIANAKKHGNRLDPETCVHIQLAVSDAKVAVTVRDQGPGFDVSTVPDPTDPDRLEMAQGRGVFLMRKLSDEVAYNEVGNEVTLTFLAPA